MADENETQSPTVGPVYREKPVELIVNRADQPVDPAPAPKSIPGVPVIGYDDVDPRNPVLKPAEGVDVKTLGEPAGPVLEPAVGEDKPAEPAEDEHELSKTSRKK